MKLKKKVLLSTLLLASVIAVNAGQGAFADSTASQTVTGTLGTRRQIEATGTALTGTIDTESGNLSAALTPAFKITTNTSANQNLALTATCKTTTTDQNAISGTGTAGTTYLTLTNNTVLPLAASVTDAQGAATDNPNVISYQLTPPSNVGSDLVYTWVPSPAKWTAVLAKKGITNTSLSVPAATTPKANTYTADDEAGDYKATVTLSFV